jgi:hypothetical protein
LPSNAPFQLNIKTQPTQFDFRDFWKGIVMSKFIRIKRLVARAGGGARSFAKRMKSRLLAMVSRKAQNHNSDRFPKGDAALSECASMQAIMDRRQKLEAQIEAAARQGFIQDGLAMCLLDNFFEELAERRRLLTELEHALQATMRRLEAMAPPPKPEPESGPTPPRPRRFTNFRDWLNGTPGVAK